MRRLQTIVRHTQDTLATMNRCGATATITSYWIRKNRFTTRAGSTKYTYYFTYLHTHTWVYYYISHHAQVIPRGRGLGKNVQGCAGRGRRRIKMYVKRSSAWTDWSTIYTADTHGRDDPSVYYYYYLFTYGAGVCSTCDSNAEHRRMLLLLWYLLLFIIIIIITIDAYSARAILRRRWRWWISRQRREV